jgi:hypothetical protein
MIEAVTTRGRSKPDAAVTSPFRDMIRPLVIAPLAALTVLGGYMVLVKHVGPYLLIMLLIAAPFVYAAEILFVMPLLWLWPVLHRPSFAVGAAWGALAAWGFLLVLETTASFPPRFATLPSTWRQWQDFGLLCLPGVASGLLFSYLTRRNCGADS